ncbi:hypothetical protein [Maribellus sp. YY47]|uniref:hypothetical protein n=1 Tax=Maribellus sp. YY47 TaxID=2929486 RepID=UPI00200153B5|nr:hypothetical protein [Maribellus sp. YY47]MCK3684421.1 hypothetical protein [Maribellus sp. YY47]
MKTFKWMTVLLFAGLLSAGITAKAEEKSKEYNKSWTASEVATLQIINKFGEVKINNNGGSEITIDVKVTVEAATEKKTNELLDLIDVQFQKNGKTIKAETKIENDFKSQKRFSIDYTVNIPSDKNLMIENKYGNTSVNRLEANGDFQIKYGNFSANALLTPEGGSLHVDLAYGNASIGEATNLNALVAYSPMTIETLHSLKLESKYSSVELGEGKDIQIESKYDKFRFGKLESVTAVTKYSQISIDELSKSIKIEAGYGGVKLATVSPDFEFIDITNSYGQISLGLNEANYSIDASCDYCGISYPQESFEGNRIRENNSQTLKGKVGSGEGGKVYVRSRYGEIKLTN